MGERRIDRIETRLVDSTGNSHPAEFLLDSTGAYQKEGVFLTLIWGERQITKGAGDFFGALCDIRIELEKEQLRVSCIGASRNVYPSGMLRDMGLGKRAYRCEMGRPVDGTSYVNTFDIDSGLDLSTVAEQQDYYYRWLKSCEPPESQSQ